MFFFFYSLRYGKSVLDAWINECETFTRFFVLKPFGLSELTLCVSFQVDLREDALQSKRTAGSKVAQKSTHLQVTNHYTATSLCNCQHEHCIHYIMRAQVDKPCWTTGWSLVPSFHLFLPVPPANHYPALLPPPPLHQWTLLWKSTIHYGGYDTISKTWQEQNFK